MRRRRYTEDIKMEAERERERERTRRIRYRRGRLSGGRSSDRHLPRALPGRVARVHSLVEQPLHESFSDRDAVQ
jgi:hypothetical protein